MDSVILENDRVRVLRVQHAGRERKVGSRHDRLIIYLNDGQVIRTEHGKQPKREEIQRKAGDVVWRAASEHEIENAKPTKHEVIIVEFK